MSPLQSAEALCHGTHELPRAHSLGRFCACFLHRKVLRNTDKRNLMDIYHISLLLCALSVVKRRKYKVPKTLSMQISFFYDF